MAKVGSRFPVFMPTEKQEENVSFRSMAFAKKLVRNRINWIFTGFGPNVEVCLIQLKTGIQFLTGLAFRICQKIQLKSSKVI